MYTAAVAGLTGAMPQLQARPVNLALAGGNDDIVRSVVDNIQPAVEAAVAQALRTLQVRFFYRFVASLKVSLYLIQLLTDYLTHLLILRMPCLRNRKKCPIFYYRLSAF